MKAPGRFLIEVFRCWAGLFIFGGPLVWGRDEFENYTGGLAPQPYVPVMRIQELPLSEQYGVLQSALEYSSQPYASTYYPVVYPVPASQKLLGYTEEEKDLLLDQALKTAWEEYGPKKKQRITKVVASPSHYSHRDTSSAVPLVPLIGFQASDSEWDQHVTKLSAQPFPPPPQSNFFTRLLSSYIDFEVNHHEIADFLRRAVALVFIGILIFAWISLGSFLGLFSMKSIFGAGRTRSDLLDLAEGRMDTLENDASSELTGRVYVALEGGWLRKLQEKIEKETARKTTGTFVQCCILPDKKKSGVADCRIVERGKIKKGFKCSSNLTYNFQFGPQTSLGGKGKGKSSPVF